MVLLSALMTFVDVVSLLGGIAVEKLLSPTSSLALCACKVAFNVVASEVRWCCTFMWWWSCCRVLRKDFVSFSLLIHTQYDLAAGSLKNINELRN
jgi:hypothetical protein